MNLRTVAGRLNFTATPAERAPAQVQHILDHQMASAGSLKLSNRRLAAHIQSLGRFQTGLVPIMESAE